MHSDVALRVAARQLAGRETAASVATVDLRPGIVAHEPRVFAAANASSSTTYFPFETPPTYEQVLEQGREFAAKGKDYFPAAIDRFEFASRIHSRAAQPHIELARIAIASKDTADANREANAAVELAPRSSKAWNTKGRAELSRRNYDAAIAAFAQAIQLNPNNVWARNNLGYTALLQKNFELAVHHLEQATKRKNSATGYMFNNLGLAREHLDRLDEARVAYKEGAQRGSKEAAASYKRLEGVKTLAGTATPNRLVAAVPAVGGLPSDALVEPASYRDDCELVRMSASELAFNG